jgi:hypothetical protein
MKFLKAFGEFWYDFIIGDDWKIALAVVLALAATLLVLSLGIFGDIGVAVFGGLAIVVAFAISLAIDVRPKSSS